MRPWTRLPGRNRPLPPGRKTFLALALGLLFAGGCTEEEGRCGDGKVDSGEACDDGADNSDFAPGACRTTCQLASCGDEVIDPGEECDDGAANGTKGACRADCVLPFCGDGKQDPGEECDWGGANDDSSSGGCRTNCRRPYCGDGVVGDGEHCDDGAGNSDVQSNACRTDCRLAWCGDGTLDDGEFCDDGERNDDWAPDACRLDCTLPYCGDRVIDSGEECDDGDREGRDGCTADCRYPVPANCAGLGIPVQDLRMVGTPIEGGFTVSGTLPAGEGVLLTESCGGTGTEVIYGFPVPAYGDLVVELHPTTPGYAPVLAVRQSCAGLNVTCVAGEAGGGPLRRVVPDVWPFTGMYYLHVDGAAGPEAGYALTVRLRPPLTHGEPCAIDGSLGRCDPQGNLLGCSDPDGDGTGTCLPYVGGGRSCDPDGVATLCREPYVCRDGTCQESCGDGVRQRWEGCDDGNTVDGDLCSSACDLPAATCAEPVPLDLLWDPVTKRMVWNDDTSRIDQAGPGTCLVESGVAAAIGRFVVPETGKYAVGLDPGAILSVLSRCEPPEELACGVGDPDRQELFLEAGQELFLVATAKQGRELYGPFTLTLASLACGDGVVGGFEECDDGNTEGGDRCLPDCTLPGDSCADRYPLPPPDEDGVTRWSGPFAAYVNDGSPACATYSSEDALGVFTAPAAGRYSFQLRTSGPWGEGAAILSVRTGDCDDGALQGCLSSPGDGLPAAVAATLAAGEQAYVWIDLIYGAESFSLSVEPMSCGDGKRTRPEECDDGNTIPGDGCDAACGVETVAEVEPNDLRARAQPLEVGATLRGTIASGDLDFVRLSLEAGVAYQFETFLDGWERCPASHRLATILRLHGPDGTLVGLGKAGSGQGDCAFLRFVPEVAGTYYLRIEPEFSGSPSVVEYLLRTGTEAP